jgi:hypothetical protein
MTMIRFFLKVVLYTGVIIGLVTAAILKAVVAVAAGVAR